jgi:hypothetical protein
LKRPTEAALATVFLTLVYRCVTNFGAQQVPAAATLDHTEPGRVLTRKVTRIKVHLQPG